MGRRWTTKHLADMRRLAPTHTLREMSVEMGISYSSLYQKCVEYSIQPVSEKPQWPKHIRYYILGHWYLSNRELADRTGCPIDSVRRLLNSTYGPGWRTKIMKREMEVNA